MYLCHWKLVNLLKDTTQGIWTKGGILEKLLKLSSVKCDCVTIIVLANVLSCNKATHSPWMLSKETFGSVYMCYCWLPTKTFSTTMTCRQRPFQRIEQTSQCFTFTAERFRALWYRSHVAFIEVNFSKLTQNIQIFGNYFVCNRYHLRKISAQIIECNCTLLTLHNTFSLVDPQYSHARWREYWGYNIPTIFSLSSTKL